MDGKIEKRRKAILDLLSQVPISSTAQLASAMEVSTETMRKDLDALADEGMIIKIHGGVALANSTPGDAPFDLRTQWNIDEKRKIALAASTLIAENDSIIIESSTTGLELAKVLLDQSELLKTLVIITNSLSIAALFDGGAKCQKLFFLGGWINPAEHATRGYHTQTAMKDFCVNKSFISGAALGNDMVLTSYLDEDMIFQRQAIQCAKETVLMIHSAKFYKAAMFSVCPINQIAYVVSDQNCDADIFSALRKSGTRVILSE